MLLYKTSYSCEFEEERESPQIQWREVSCGYIFKHNAALVFPEIETVKYVRKTSLFLTKIKLQKTIHLYNNMQTSRHSCVVLKKEDGNSNFLLSPKTGSGVDHPVLNVSFFLMGCWANTTTTSTLMKQSSQQASTARCPHFPQCRSKLNQHARLKSQVGEQWASGLQECRTLWCLSKRREDVDSPGFFQEQAPGTLRGWSPEILYHVPRTNNDYI